MLRHFNFFQMRTISSLLGLIFFVVSSTLHAQYHLVWADEFSQTGMIDTSKWFHQTLLPNGTSWYNGEQQHYTDRLDNSFVDSGYLHIVAKRETFTDQGQTKQFTSARLNSKFAFTYGKVVVRAKLPTGVGTWPAIWMLGKNITEPGAYWEQQGFGTTPWPACGEIDIMEHWGNNQNYISAALHTPSSFGGTVNTGGLYATDVSNTFHIYEMEWDEDQIVFSLDGQPFYTYAPSPKDPNNWPYTDDQYLLLNTAIESVVDPAFMESPMIIDYIRIYQDTMPAMNDVLFDAYDSWVGYINVFELPSNGNAYQFGYPTGLGDLKSTLDSSINQLILQPNFSTHANNSTDPYWVNQTTGEGNKEIEASTYAEPGNTYNGENLQFSGYVISNSLDSNYTASFFIKALDPNNNYQDALGGTKFFTLPDTGFFSVSATAAELASGLIVQYGFSVRGPNADPSLDSLLGNVVIGNASYSQNIVPFDAKDNWIGYTNVYELPSQGNAFQFGYVSSLPDLKSTLDTNINQLILQPNFTTYANNTTDPFWVDQSTGEGNKWLVASTYVEPGTSFNETDLTFSGNVSLYTLDSNYSATFFIKALDPSNNYQDVLGGAKDIQLPNSGPFSVSALAQELPNGLIVQYGFSIKGPNANPLDESILGRVIIGDAILSAVPTVEEVPKIVVFPNPAQSVLHIKGIEKAQLIRVYDMSGQCVYEKTNPTQLSVDISQLNNGIYTLELTTNKKNGGILFLKS